MHMIADHVQNKPKPRILDFASGIGNESILMADAFNASIDAVNISEHENTLAKQMIAKFGSKLPIKLHVASDVTKFEKQSYDVVFAGEILEHQAEPDVFLDDLEKVLKPNGLMSITVPFGQWDDSRHAHLWNFERYDLAKMLEDKKNLSIKIVSAENNFEKQSAKGWWVVTYNKNQKPCKPINLDRKILINAPRQTVSLCMITKDAESMLHRCLKSVEKLVDEIIICDNGSTDSTLDIAKQYGAKIITCEPATDIGFDTARNHSIKHATSDWILWLDADEELLEWWNIIKYLRDNMFNGYSLKQHHFTADGSEIKIDLPVRMFRNNKGIKFLGHVHEHPELGINEGVGASTVISDSDIAHDGYLTESVRRGRFVRNIELMRKDRQLNPDRLLGKFLWLRDLVHLARYEIQKSNGQPNAKIYEYCNEAAELFRSDFLSTSNMYQPEALAFYSESLKMLNLGIEYTFNIACSKSDPQPQQYNGLGRFLNKDEFFEYINSKYSDISEPYEGEFI
jgi:glycosyltransferase involved in cell wall biosynthesis